MHFQISVRKVLTISRPISRDCMHILRTARQFLGNHKNNEFMGKFMEISGREESLPASVENHFHSETIGFVYEQYSLLQVQLNLQKKRDCSF